MQFAVGFKLQGMTEYEVQARATREKTARLKALRLDRDAQGGCIVGFHSRASFCASMICAGVIFVAIISRFWTYSSRSFLSKTTT